MGSTAVAHVGTRSQADYASVHGCSVVQMFNDVKAAFASMVRSLAVPVGVSDDVFAARLLRFGFSSREVASIVRFVKLRIP